MLSSHRDQCLSRGKKLNDTELLLGDKVAKDNVIKQTITKMRATDKVRCQTLQTSERWQLFP